MKNLRIFCLSFVVVAFLVGPLVTTSLSTTEMKSTWGGVMSCKDCSKSKFCGNTSCVFSINYCKDQSGGSYKVCDWSGDPDDECSHGDVSCGTETYCDEGVGGCSQSTPVCTCGSRNKTVTGCTP